MVAHLLDDSKEFSRNPLEESKELLRNTLPKDFHNGAWFEKLLYLSVNTYHKKVTA